MGAISGVSTISTLLPLGSRAQQETSVGAVQGNKGEEPKFGLPGQDDSSQGEGSPAAPPQFAGCEGDNENEEEIEQRPDRYPGGAGAVNAKGMQ